MMVILRDKDRWAVCNLRLYMYMQIIISITPNGCFFFCIRSLLYVAGSTLGY